MAIGGWACGGPTPAHRFERVETTDSGIDFVNLIETSDSFNILLYEYIYNGGGVGVGDFDGNGLPDLVFAGNRVSSKIYLQRAPWEFEDITEASGMATSTWCAGVNVADFDGDGRDDIFFATLDITGGQSAPNLLFVQDGDAVDGAVHFREAASEFGLDNRSYSTHSAWLDLEGDGDLDLYLLNNAIEDESRNTPRGTDTSGRGASVDVVYRNRGPGTSPRFETTDYAKTEGWGLGVAVHDFNEDGLSDVYVANDFLSDDLLLINDGGEGFRESSRTALQHTSYNAMGVDVADLDGDGLAEIVTVDMLPDDNLRRKMMFADVPVQADRISESRGYTKQYVRNTLQRANGDGTFSEVGLQAGVAATDWSWAPLLADFDNDGDRDLFVSNGYPKDITNQDFVAYSATATQFGTREAQLAKVSAALDQVQGVHQANQFFRNDGDLSFANVSTEWQADEPTYANGAVYVDLDNDGDLDLVTNNINEPAGLYRNMTRERDTSSTHYLKIHLRGRADNPTAIGAKVYVKVGSRTLTQEHHRQRGYLSTVGEVLHFGLGTAQRADSVWVLWPGGETSLLTDLPVDRTLAIARGDHASSILPPRPHLNRLPGLIELVAPTPPTHAESTFSDFELSSLTLRDHSKAGPAMCVVAGGRLSPKHLVVGGGAGQPTSVYAFDGLDFRKLADLDGSSDAETTALLAFDYDGDGDEDLYEGRGSTEFVGRERLLADQVYRNDDGRFTAVSDVLPDGIPPGYTSVVQSGDLDGDGDADLFIGSGAAVAGFPGRTDSYTLINDGSLYRIGQRFAFVAAVGAVLSDLNGDGLTDLAVASELEPLAIYHNEGGRLVKVERPIKSQGPIATRGEITDGSVGPTGWWYSLSALDLDGDGDLDLLAGNVGNNTSLRASAEQPLRVTVADIDGNGAIDPIVTVYDADGRTYPVHPRNALTRQVPSLKRFIPQFRDYTTWDGATISGLSEQTEVYEVDELGSIYFENDGEGSFTQHRLPQRAQEAPLRAAISWNGPSVVRFGDAVVVGVNGGAVRMYRPTARPQ